MSQKLSQICHKEFHKPDAQRVSHLVREFIEEVSGQLLDAYVFINQTDGELADLTFDLDHVIQNESSHHHQSGLPDEGWLIPQSIQIMAKDTLYNLSLACMWVWPVTDMHFLWPVADVHTWRTDWESMAPVRWGTWRPCHWVQWRRWFWLPCSEISPVWRSRGWVSVGTLSISSCAQKKRRG